MISKLSKWIVLSGAILSATGGFINAIGFLSIYHEAVTHLTGTTTLLAISMATLQTPEAAHLASLIAAFVLGAALSAFIIRDAVLRMGRRYGLVMILEGALLFFAGLLLSRGQRLGEYLAASACGMQNGMASTFSGAVVRTTHVSGIWTDLGIFLGQWLRRVPVDVKRAKLYAALVGGFFLGGALGALGFAKFQARALYLPAGFIFLFGILYAAYWHRRRTA